MNKVINIRTFPTSLETEYVKNHLDGSGFHESLLRSHQTLQYVKELLALDTPSSVILELISLCYEYIPTETENKTKQVLRDIQEYESPLWTALEKKKGKKKV